MNTRMINLPLQSSPKKPWLQSHAPVWALQVPWPLQVVAGSQATAKSEMGNVNQLL